MATKVASLGDEFRMLPEVRFERLRLGSVTPVSWPENVIERNVRIERI